MAFSLPPPPKSRGVVGLIVTLLFVCWTGYLLLTDKRTPTSAVTSPEPKNDGPVFMEIDLRGRGYDTGRYEGFQKGKEAKAKGFGLPTGNVLAFQATEAAKTQATKPGETDDFIAGYQSGFAQAMKP